MVAVQKVWDQAVTERQQGGTTDIQNNCHIFRSISYVNQIIAYLSVNDLDHNLYLHN
jgi:hypothetical protein